MQILFYTFNLGETMLLMPFNGFNGTVEKLMKRSVN
jgi:hypothetical protein